MAKIILFDQEARQALVRGVDAVADAVKTTLGPRGRNVGLDRRPHLPLVTHDGVTVAKDIELFDMFENMGAQLLKAAALRTNELAGDGTTTATIVAQAIVHEGLHAMAAGANPMLIRRGLDLGIDQAIKILNGMARAVQGRDEIASVATIAAADSVIGNMLADLIDQVGKDGVISVELSPALGISTEFHDGLEIDHGWISPYFMTDEGRQEAVLEESAVLITDLKLKFIGQVVPVLERVLDAGVKNLLIIAEDVTDDALSTLVLTKLKGNLNVVAVKAPGYGDRRKVEIEDLAALTGAKVIAEDEGHHVEHVTMRQLGMARRVVAGKEATTIHGAVGADAGVQSRIRALRQLLTEPQPDYEREWMQKRLARLSTGVGVIRVGSSTKTEAEERKMRIEDALGATKAAIADGVLPGGGVALVNVARALGSYALAGDQGVGISILRRAMEEPLRLLAENSGDQGSVVIGTIRRLQSETGNPNIGYNVMDSTYPDMIDVGIIDPVRVTRIALENAVSVAGLILTTEALVTDPREIRTTPIPKPKSAPWV